MPCLEDDDHGARGVIAKREASAIKLAQMA